MTPKHRNIFIGLAALSVLSLIGLLVMLPSLPEQIPIHWNFEGEIDNYGNKWLIVFFGALPLLLLLLFWALPKIDPGKDNFKKHMGPYLGMSVVITLLLIGMGWMTALAAKGFSVHVERVIPVLVGGLLIFLGNYMPRIRHNYTFGIRTPWTLASETVWRKAHRVSGIWYLISGILMVLTAFFPYMWLVVLSVGALAGSVVFSLAYSWYLYQKEQKSK